MAKDHQKSSPTPSLNLLDVSVYPTVPADNEAVVASGAKVRRRFPDADRAEGVLALRELSKHTAQLGDLAPDPAQCATLADEIERTSSALVRLDALRGYLSAWRGAREESAQVLIDRGHREAVARIDAGRLAADNVQNLTKFVDARGQAVSDGIAQARALKDKPIA